MQDWDLLDIKPVTGKFTWSNKRVGLGHIAARLDRFFVQSSFLLLGLEARMHILHSSVSDHKPISLKLLAPKDLGPILFRFRSLWTKEAEFMQKARDCWKDPVKGSPFFVWEEKLRRVKAMLKNWAKTLPNPATERKKFQNSLETQHLHLEATEITKEELDKESQIQQKFQKVCLAEEEFWRLKSRSLWLKAGFCQHKKATSEHFKKMYSEGMEAGQSSKLLDVVLRLITTRMNQLLERKINKNEVRDALFAMDPDKASGPDGFTTRFL
eukprot:PITA_15950